MIGPADLREELYGLIDRLSATRGLENVLNEVLQAAMTLTGSEMGTISPISASTRSFGQPIYRGFSIDYVEHMAEQRGPVKDGPRERAFLSGRQVLIPDVFEDPAFTPFLPWVRRAGFISMQATPIFSRDHDPVGVICTFQRTQHTPASEHLGLLDLYAKLAGDAIEREYAESSLRDREENFQCLYELMIGLAGARTLDDALHEVLSAAIGLVGANAGHIRLRDPESGKLRLSADTGFKEDFLLRHGDRARKFLSRSPSIDAIVQGRRIVVEDLDSYPPFEPHRDILAAEGYRSLQATPLIGHTGEAIGSVTTFCTGRHVPTAAQLQVLDLYARLAAEAIERMRTEDALRVSEERLRLATQGAKVYPWELDLTSQRVWYDGNLTALQAPPPGLHARRILSLIHPEDRGALLRTFRQAASHAGEFELEVRASDRTGGPRWFRISGNRVEGRRGSSWRLVGTCKDITDHKRTESRLRHSEERFRRLYGLMVRLSGTSGYQAALDEVLGAVLEVLGTDMGTIWLREPADESELSLVASRGLAEEYLEYFAAHPPPEYAPSSEAMRDGQAVFVEDMVRHPAIIPHKDVVRRAGLSSLLVWPIRSRNGSVIGAIKALFQQKTVPSADLLQVLELYSRLATDAIERGQQLDERRRSEQSLREALAAKDEFLGLVSHELRTPMTVIRGLASVLDRNPDLPFETRRETHADLRKESERLYHLIENMLALARVQAGQQRSMELVLVDKLIEGIGTNLRTELPGAALALTPLPRNAMVKVVPEYIGQILHNLVENATKYSPRDSLIELGSRAADDWVEVWVADRGIGIKDPSALFKLFSREDQAEKIASGMGLGLAVCRTLVEAQSGRIWAEQRDGGGTIIRFVLPRSEAL